MNVFRWVPRWSSGFSARWSSSWWQGLPLVLLIAKVSADSQLMDEDLIESPPSPRKESWGYEVGAALGGGIGLRVFGSDQDHHFGLGKVHFAWNRTRTFFPEQWYRGEVSLRQELMWGGQFDPGPAYLVGVTPLLLYRLSYWSEVSPFVGGGAGIMLTDIGEPSLGSEFEFYEQVGIGLEWQSHSDFTVAAEARYMHISNAGIKGPNRGINGVLFFLGAKWQF